MAIGRISGPLLKSNLIRNGIDLAFETDLLYLDVNNQRIGIKSSSPTHELQVNGTTKTTDLIVDNRADIADVTIEGNTISTTEPYLNLATLDTVVSLNKLRIDSIDIEGNAITTNSSNANLELRPNGTGSVDIHSNLNVDGNVYVTGNITADGTINIGNEDTDNVVFRAEVASNIIPDDNGVYNLGSSSKVWNDVWVNNIVASSVNSGDLNVDGIDLTFRQGNIWYVAANGNDSNSGDHIQDPFASVKYALSAASAGDTVYIFPGEYEEEFPLTVPVGVTVMGQGIRAVSIVPTLATNNKDAFLLNGETTVENLTVKNFFYDSINDTGYAFRFAPNFTVTSRSPYVKNITVITQGSTTSALDPRGFDTGDAGKGAYFDGSVATASSIEASALFHSATFITPGVDAITLTNGVRVEWLNSFTYFANRSIYAVDGASGLYNDGKTRIRLSGVSGPGFAALDTVTFTSTDSSTVVNVTVESVENGNILVVDGKNTDLLGFDWTPASISNGSGTTAVSIENVDIKDFGAEVRLIGSASVYGNFGLVGDGPGVLMYAIGHNMAYIGVGKEVTNDAEAVIQANEVVEANNANIRYNTVDHKGDFRVGDLFYVNQEDGTVEFSVSDFIINTTGGVTFVTNGNTTFIDGTKIETGDWRISGNTIETLTQDANFAAASGEINLNGNVSVSGNLDVSGNVTIGGNITIGDEATDTIQIVAGIESDIIPSQDSVYNLGVVSKRWNNLWINEINVGDIQIRDNFIETTVSNADLELRANGTGEVLIPNNDVVIENNLTVLGESTFSSITFNGTLLLNGDLTQTGNFTISDNINIGGNLSVAGTAQFEEILINDNFITTTSSNADLELRANGTGKILIPSNDVEISNNLQVSGTVSSTDLTVAGELSSDRFTNGNVLIDDNFITTTEVNSDLELTANGSGTINVPSNNVIIEQNLTVNGTTNLKNTLITGSIIQTGDVEQTGNFILNGSFTNNNIVINDNFITTTESNSDLELRAAGTGKVLVPSNDVEISNSLEVLGNTLLADTNITGNLTHTGNVSQTGNYTVTGNYTITGLIVSDSSAQFENIRIDGNVISTTDSNSDLELRANGAGEILIPNNDVVITNDLRVDGTISVGDVTSLGTITANRFSTGDILIDDNFITTTTSNSNLELRANGTGNITVPVNNVAFGQDLTVDGQTTLADLNVVGEIIHSGDATQTGNFNLTGNLLVTQIATFSSAAQFENVRIDGNVITTTESNSDLELRANGTGSILIPNNDVFITNDINVDGTLSVENITASGTITANRFSTGDILIDDNFITTTLLDSNLELRANGAGNILVPENDVLIEQSLTVTGLTTINDLTVNQTLVHNGDVDQTGNILLNGNLVVSNVATFSSAAQFENIKIDGNVITTTDSNSDLELRANGSGNVLIPNNDVVITNDLIVGGTITVGNINSIGTIQANSFTTGDILIDDNFITTTTSNSNLELRANGTGSIIVSDLSVNSSTISSADDIVLSPGSEIVVIDSTGALRIPVGTTLERPTATTGQIRFNTTLNRFEGYTGSNWIQLNGVGDVDGDTTVTAELTEGANDNVIRFNVAGTTIVDINSTRLNAPRIEVDSIIIDGNTISTTTNTNLVLNPQGTGSVVIDNFSIRNNIITNTVADSVTTFNNTGDGYVKIGGTYGMVIPAGGNAQRPPLAFTELGQMRWNTDASRVEVFDGSNWVSAAGSASGISRADAENLAFEIVLSLG